MARDLAGGAPREAEDDLSAQPAAHAEILHAPLALEGLPSGIEDIQGREIPVPCTTCHGIEGLVEGAPSVDDMPGGPHAGLQAEHGERPCTACHDGDDLSQLHLADGTALPMVDAIELCGQCHGPQRRDFEHGSHGGMRGHWDAARGPRLRNHCIDCHDPHRPAFPRVMPMPAPRDRFRPASGDHHAGDTPGHTAEVDDEPGTSGQEAPHE